MQFNMHSKFPYGFNFRFPGHYRGSFKEWSVGIQNQLVLTGKKAVQGDSYTVQHSKKSQTANTAWDYHILPKTEEYLHSFTELQI